MISLVSCISPQQGDRSDDPATKVIKPAQELKIKEVAPLATAPAPSSE